MNACIIQFGRPIAYYIEQLNMPQQNYKTSEKNVAQSHHYLQVLLQLLSAYIHVFTCHKNSTFDKLKVKRIFM